MVLEIDKLLKKIRSKYTLIVYSPRSQRTILLKPIQNILERKNKSDHHYFDYADEELCGKYITNKRLNAGEYEIIGEL